MNSKEKLVNTYVSGLETQDQFEDQKEEEKTLNPLLSEIKKRMAQNNHRESKGEILIMPMN